MAIDVVEVLFQRGVRDVLLGNAQARHIAFAAGGGVVAGSNMRHMRTSDLAADDAGFLGVAGALMLYLDAKPIAAGGAGFPM